MNRIVIDMEEAFHAEINRKANGQKSQNGQHRMPDKTHSTKHYLQSKASNKTSMFIRKKDGRESHTLSSDSSDLSESDSSDVH